MRYIAVKSTKVIGLMAGFLLMAGLGLQARAQNSVTLAWDPSTDPSVAGYRVYDGVASHTYTSVTNVGAATRVMLSGLTTGTTYFFAVTSYTTTGLESPFSGQLPYLVPFPPITPTIPLIATSPN